MGQSVFKVDNIKGDFLKKIDGLSSTQKAAAILAWNLLIGKIILSLGKSIVDLTAKKTKDSVILAKKEAEQSAINVKKALTDKISSQTNQLIDGYKDPSLDSLKENSISANDVNNKKSVSINNIVQKSRASGKAISDKIESLKANISTLNSLKI
jgi:hypothetical protein